jgi:hypothetical protein
LDEEQRRGEVALVDHLQRFLAAREHDVAERDAQLYEVCWNPAEIFQQELDKQTWWPQGAWIDDIIASDHTLSPEKLDIEGIMIWSNAKATDFWVEPFAGSLFISPEGDGVLGYQLRCGDSSRGLGTMPLKGPVPSLPQNWIFEVAI